MSAERSNYMYSIKRTFTITIVEGILILTPKVPETNPSVTVSGAGEFSDSGHQSLNQDLIRT